MSSSAIINDIGTTLGLIIEKQWNEDPKISGINCPLISFDSPYELVKSSAPGQHLSIFLFQVSENSHLRNMSAGTYIDEGSGSERTRDQPLALDLLYLVTAISNTSSPLDPTNEKRILGRAMQIFNDNKEVPNEKFSKELYNEIPDISYSKIKIYFHNITMDDLTKIWTSFHETPYRLSVAYLVTPVFIDSLRFEVLPKRVIDSTAISTQAVPKEDD